MCAVIGETWKYVKREMVAIELSDFKEGVQLHITSDIK